MWYTGISWNLKRLVLCSRVDLLLDLRVNDTLADIFVDGVIGKAQIVLVSQATETVSRGLEQEFLRQSQLRTQRNDLLRGVHTDGGGKRRLASP